MAICLALVIAGLIEPLANLFAHVSTDYGEGFNAYWAAAAMQGASALYSPAHVMVADNYPPLSFYLIGELGRVTGDNIFAGRIVALAAMIATAGLAGRIVVLLGASVRWGWATALLLLVFAEHLFGHFVAVDNPQWLAQAIMLAGVIPLVRSPDGPSPGDCLMSAGAMVVAVLVKHNLFAFPLASALWLAAYHRQALVRWGLGIVLLSGLAAAGLYAIFGAAMFVEIVGYDRTVDWRNFGEGLIKLACFIPLLLVLMAVAGRARHDRRWVLFASAAVLGLVMGAVQRLGAGVYINAHYEALVALTIITGHAFGGSGANWREPFGSMRWQSALRVAVLAPVLITLPRNISDWSGQLARNSEMRSAWAADIADVHQAHGLVLCEIPAICYWSGKPFIVDFFAYGQKYRKSGRPLQLYDWISSRKADVIILEKPDPKTGREPRLPPPFPHLIGRQYQAIRIISPGDIYEMVPRMPSLLLSLPSRTRVFLRGSA
jgi:hypothetical protein